MRLNLAGSPIPRFTREGDLYYYTRKDQNTGEIIPVTKSTNQGRPWYKNLPYPLPGSERQNDLSDYALAVWFFNQAPAQVAPLAALGKGAVQIRNKNIMNKYKTQFTRVDEDLNIANSFNVTPGYKSNYSKDIDKVFSLSRLKNTRPKGLLQDTFTAEEIWGVGGSPITQFMTTTGGDGAPKPLWNESVPTPVVVNSENYDQVLSSLAKEYNYNYTNLKRAYRRRRNIPPDLGTKYLNSAYMFNEKTGSLDGFPAIQLDNGVTLRPKAIDGKGGVNITLDTGGLRDMRSRIQNYGGTLTGEDSYSDIKGKFISFGGKRYTLTDFKKDIENGWELDNYLRMTFRGINQLDPHHMDELAAGSILNQGLDPVQSMLVTAYKVEKGIFAGHSPFNMALLPHEVHVPLTTWMNRNVRDNMKALEQEILAIPTFEGRKPYIERYVAMFRASEQKMFQFMQAYQIITDQPGTEALSPEQITDILGNLDDPELISLINQVNKTRTEKQGLMGFFGDVKESVHDMYNRIINNEAFPDPRFPTKTEDMKQEGRPKSVPKSG